MQKTLLQNKILLENGWLSHISYRNIVSIAIKLNEYAWAEKFIEDYKEKIQEKHRENAYNLSASNLLYAKHNYAETVGLLNQVEFTDVYYACTAKFIKSLLCPTRMGNLRLFCIGISVVFKKK
ncbi:MAG: hypothetical protein R2777_02150 [Chitinophagales bacterium]